MATWIIGTLLALLVGAVILKMAKDKRSGKGGCSGSCAGCHGCAGIHHKSTL